MASGLEGFPGAYPLGFTPRRSVVDPVTGRPVVSSAPTGAVQQRASLLPVGDDDSGALVPAVPQGLFDAIDAARFPGQVLRGEKAVFDPSTGHASDEALGAATGLAGLAMTGSMPFRAPKGALRSFGGAAAADDPFAALEVGLAAGMKDVAPDVRLPSRVDPGAKSWDLYHGSTGGPDFARFDLNHSKAPGHSEGGALFLTPDADTAGFYANGTGAGVEAGPRVFRTTVDPGRTKVFDLPEMIEADPALGERARSVYLAERGVPPTPADIASADSLREAYRSDFVASRARDREINAQLAEYGMEPTATTGATYGHGYLGAVIQMAKEQGLDTAVIRGLAEHGGGDQVVALTPGRVRSFYSPDQVLYSGGRGAGPAGTAALAAPNPAQAASPNQQDQPMSAGPTPGLGALAPGMTREEIAKLFGRMPMGAPQGFSGTSGTVVPEPAPDPSGSPLPPARPAAADLAAPAQAPQRAPLSLAGVPAGRALMGSPMPPPRPAEFGAPAADMPAPNAVPTSGNLPDPAGAPKAEEPSFLDGLMRGIQKTDGLLGSIGIGLLTTPGFGQGLGAGLKNYQQAGVQKAATNLANAEFQLKARRLQQETAQEDKKAARENMTAKVIASSLKIPLEQATAFAGNPEFVNSFLRNGYGAPDGYTRGPDGTLVAVPGGANDPNVIKARAQAQAEGVAAGGKDDVQLLTRPDGSIVAVNKSQIGEAGATPAVTPIMSGGSKLEAEAAERRKAVVAQGGDVNDPRYKDYILSGSLPKENQQQLTAADKQAIREGEDNVLSHRNALSQLRRGLELSPKAYEGVTAGTRAMVMTNLPAALGGGGEAAMATREFDNTMSTQMLDSLKAIFGGNPTEGERAALKDIQGISSMPQELREKVIRNTIAKVESRLGFEEQRVNDLRGGTYYKPRTGEAAAPQSAGSTEVSDPLAAARAAIAQGADANKVKTRLLKAGIDPKGL